MSLIATSKAVEVVGIKPLDKFVLMMLSDRHNKDTERCDPSVPKLASDCCMSENGIRRSLARLQEKGLIRVEHRTTAQGRDTSNFYTLTFLVAPPAGGVTLPGVQGEPPQ